MSLAHKDLKAPLSTPSGLSNRYGAILYRFPAAIEMTGITALGDALICARRWDSPSVEGERDELFSSDTATYSAYIQRFRNAAIRRAIRGFRDIKRAEKTYFGEKSYFYLSEIYDFDNIPTVSDDEASVNNNDEKETDPDNKNEDLDFAEQKNNRLTNLS